MTKSLRIYRDYTRSIGRPASFALESSPGTGSAERFGRMVSDRRARLLELLEGAPRREARARVRVA